MFPGDSFVFTVGSLKTVILRSPRLGKFLKLPRKTGVVRFPKDHESPGRSLPSGTRPGLRPLMVNGDFGPNVLQVRPLGVTRVTSLPTWSLNVGRETMD